MRLSAAAISSRLSKVGAVAIAVATVWSVQPSYGADTVRLAQASRGTQAQSTVSPPPLPLRNPARATMDKPEQKPVASQTPTATPGSWPKTLPETKAEAEGKTAAASKPEPPPNVWSDEEITKAKAMCADLLRGVAAVFVPAEPIKAGACGSAAPVELISVGNNPQVVVSPPAKLTCDMVATLAEWVEKDVQPMAKRHFGATVIRIESMSSYSCRNAYNRKRTRLSEHGLANALDIGRFVLSKGERVDLLSHWGMTERDIRAAIAAAKAAEEKRRAAEAAARAAREAAAQRKGQGQSPRQEQAQAVTPPPAPEPAPPPAQSQSKARQAAAAANKPAAEMPAAKSPRSPEVQTPLPGRLGFRSGTLIEGSPPPRPSRTAKAESADTTPPSKLGRPQPGKQATKSIVAVPAVEDDEIVIPGAKVDTRGRFLRDIHTAACKRFGTVLGPEANEAHRNHFHLDMAKRRYGSFCE